MRIQTFAPALLAVALAGLAGCRQEPADPAAPPAPGAGATAADVASTPGPIPSTGTDANPATGAAPAEPVSADASGMTPAAGSVPENAALGVLNAINEHEIAAGEQAISKKVDGEVAAYARMMIEQHSENRTKTSALGADADAAQAQAQRRKGEQELASLAAQDGDAYRKAYIDAMVKGHTEALATLDGTLIPSAGRQDVKDHLATTRQHVAEHLEQAKRLQQGR